MPEQFMILLFAALGLLALAAISLKSGQGSLDGIKSKPVGDGQHGTARWATVKEIGQTFAHVLFRPSEWRKGKNLPKAQGLVLGSQGKKGKIVALVDSDDIHCLMIGASGVGKTAFFLYPNLEYPAFMFCSISKYIPIPRSIQQTSGLPQALQLLQ